MDPDSLAYAEQKFDDLPFHITAYQDLGDCQECDAWDKPAEAEAVIVYDHAKWTVRAPKCSGCLTVEISYLRACPYTTVVRVEVPLERVAA